MKRRPDLLTDRSPAGLEVVQLTTEAVPSSHIYMEAQIFAPDSRRFLVHRSAHAHGSDRHDPEHRYLLCDLDDRCALTPITHETGATAPSVSPDGKHVYYFVNETEINGGRLMLKRVGLDGTGRRTLMLLDHAIPGTKYGPSRIYPLSSISSDGQRLALSCFLGDGTEKGIDWGLMVFDLRKCTVALVLQGPSWCNIHPQYCRSTDPEAAHDLLVQENHDNIVDKDGQVVKLVGGVGADIHVIRDDGTNFRNMPWGRDGNEACQGHQCWIGRSVQALTSTVTREPREQQFIAGFAAPFTGHLGSKTPGGVRNDLSRSFARPRFHHFGTDAAGTCVGTDWKALGKRVDAVYVADLPSAPGGPLRNYRYLLPTRTSWQKTTHPHPFLSPDGAMAFFNSDESGVLQAYMVRGWK